MRGEDFLELVDQVERVFDKNTSKSKTVKIVVMKLTGRASAVEPKLVDEGMSGKGSVHLLGKIEGRDVG